MSVSLELGLFLGAKAFSAEDKQRDKRCLILDVEPYRYQKFISDIAGQDICAHHGDALRALTETRQWLASVTKRQLPGTLEIKNAYSAFGRELPEILARLKLDRADLRYAEFLKIVLGWLQERAVD